MTLSLVQLLNQPYFEIAAQHSILYGAYVDIQKILYEVDGMHLRGFPDLPENEYAPEAAAILFEILLRSSGRIIIFDNKYERTAQTLFEQFKAPDSITPQIQNDINALTVDDIQTAYRKAMGGLFNRRKEDIGELSACNATNIIAVLMKVSQGSTAA